MGFPRIGKRNPEFSRDWKISRKFFQALELFDGFFPSLGN
jgi:hypothetical protein